MDPAIPLTLVDYGRSYDLTAKFVVPVFGSRNNNTYFSIAKMLCPRIGLPKHSLRVRIPLPALTILNYCTLKARDLSYVVSIVSNDDSYDRNAARPSTRVYE